MELRNSQFMSLHLLFMCNLFNLFKTTMDHLNSINNIIYSNSITHNSNIILNSTNLSFSGTSEKSQRRKHYL